MNRCQQSELILLRGVLAFFSLQLQRYLAHRFAFANSLAKTHDCRLPYKDDHLQTYPPIQNCSNRSLKEETAEIEVPEGYKRKEFDCRLFASQILCRPAKNSTEITVMSVSRAQKGKYCGCKQTATNRISSPIQTNPPNPEYAKTFSGMH